MLQMNRSRRPVVALVALLVSLLAVSGGVGIATPQPATADVTTHTPVMGPSLLSASQLAHWYALHHGSVQPLIPAFGGYPANDVQALAQVFINVGKMEGVRGDMAFVQSMLETGWLGFVGSQIPPDAFNYAGIFAFDGRQYVGYPGPRTCAHGDTAPSRCFGNVTTGVLMQIQLLRSYADPTSVHAPNRLISAPYPGVAPLWEYFGGHNCPCGHLVWASANDYGLRIILMYSQALADNGMAGACVPYSPPVAGPTSGTGYWEVTSDGAVHPLGTAHDYGDVKREGIHLNAPLVGGASLSTATGYWLLGRDGGVFTFGAAKYHGSTGGMHLNKPVNGIEPSPNDNGYWLVADDGGVFTFNVPYYGSTGGLRLNKPVLGMTRTLSGKGYWLFASDGGIFTFGDAKYHGGLGGAHLTSPVLAMQRTVSGNGYWLMTADGRVYPFGDARTYGDIAGCRNYGGANRLLRTPNGGGYWIATHDGSVIAFGDAKKIGFPSTVGGTPVGLLGAK
jgi:hypothetical protein